MNRSKRAFDIRKSISFHSALHQNKRKINMHSNIVSLSRAWAPVYPLGRRISTSRSLRKIYNVQSVEDFDERVKNSNRPVIVDFFASWCSPCKALTPRIESAIQEFDGNVDLVKVDVDEYSDLALDYDVSSVPVLVVIKNGKEINRLVGLQDIEKLRSLVRNMKE